MRSPIRSRRESSAGSDGTASNSSWLRFRDKSENSDGGNSSTEQPVSPPRWTLGRKMPGSKAENKTTPSEAGSSEKVRSVKKKSKKEGTTMTTSPTSEVTAASSASSHTGTSDPPRRNAELGRGIDSIVYSPASSARATPSSDMFFGSGNTTPSLITSPPPHSSTFASPTFSPPLSPLMNFLTTQPGTLTSTGEEYKLTLQPVPKEAKKEAKVDMTKPQTNVENGNSSTKSKEEVEKTSDLEDKSAPAREQKKYIRRRYTDSRHPTTELPDIRLEVPESMSVQYPPIRKQPKIKGEEGTTNVTSIK